MIKAYQSAKSRFPEWRTFFVGNYLPRNCGIATFTYDLSHAIGNEIGASSFGVIAINNIPEGYDYPKEVVFEIQQNKIQDYRLAAEYINLSGIDLVCLQHEFGIFGGPEGRYIIHFLANLKKPVVTTLHTVLKTPSAGYRQGLLEVARFSHALVVMSRMAEDILREVYDIPPEKIHFIPHGVPDVPFIDPNFYKDKFQVEGRLVLLTFGLLNPNKGIENVLEALPAVIQQYPNVAYIILGATHPEVKRVQGDEYRISLQRLVRKLGLEQHVLFYNRFVDLEELCEFIGACDIYITPYLNQEQIVSGTLAYAVGMGKAVVSTPYWYAQELLAEGRGRLVEFGNIKELGQTLIELIKNEVERHQMRKKAYELGRKMIWKEVAREYLKVFEKAITGYRAIPPDKNLIRQMLPPLSLPEVRLDHLLRLTDNTGIMQHATRGIPDRRYGYSTDDIGRALVVILMHYQQFQEPGVLSLAEIYLSFLSHAQLDDGRFHNFMDYSRHFLDEVGSEDTLGRALWGLGYAVMAGHNEGFRTLARELFEKGNNAAHRLTFPRAMAYAICGLYYYLQHYPGATAMKRTLQALADNLVGLYEKNREEGWFWLEPFLTYANAKIPHSLLLAYCALNHDRYLWVGKESLDFLTHTLYNGEYFDLIGNQGWYYKGKKRALYSQQPIDAGYLVEAYVTAYEITKQEDYRQWALTAFEWFLGRNRLGIPLYDFSRAACYDGLDSHGINVNQGAESIICFLLALLNLSQPQIQKALHP
jgi:glycosyltransferase involved in cell wall biosynthesis